jgi:hypothetical protein
MAITGTELLQAAKTGKSLYSLIIFFVSRNVDQTLLKAGKASLKKAKDAFEGAEKSNNKDRERSRGVTFLIAAYIEYLEYSKEEAKQGWFSKPLTAKEKMPVYREIVLVGAFIALAYKDLGDENLFIDWKEKTEARFKEYESITKEFAMDCTFFIEMAQGGGSRWSFYEGTYNRIQRECDKVRNTINTNLGLSIQKTQLDIPTKKDGIPVHRFSQDMISLYLDDPFLYR